MTFWSKVKQYWISIINLILLCIITYLSIKYPNIPSFWFILILLISLIFSFIKEVQQSHDYEKLTALIQANKDSDKERDKILKQQIKNNEEWQNKKGISLNLLDKLLNEGLIDREDTHKPFSSHEIFALYCFPTFPTLSKDGKMIYRIDKRLYPNFLKNLGFIRLHLRKGLFYVIQKERLEKKLQNTFILKKYILDCIGELLPKEWNTYLEGLKKSRKKILNEEYNKLKDKNYKDYVKFNILLLNTDLSENNIGYLEGKRAFNNEFHNFLLGQVDLRKINVSKEVKGRIIEFINRISFELFFFEEKKSDLDKLKAKEQDIKSNLNIIKWEDYLSKNEQDLANEISKAGFSESKSLEYARLLKQRIGLYLEALKDLKINY